MFTHLGEFIMAFKRGKCTSLVQRTDLALPSSWVVPRPVGKEKTQEQAAFHYAQLMLLSSPKHYHPFKERKTDDWN